MSAPSSPVKPTLSSLNVDFPSLSSNFSNDQISPSTSRGRSFSQVKLPSFRISTPGSPKSGYEHPPVAQRPDPTQRYRDESRKLLAHILRQLRDRTKPESVFHAFKSSGTYGAESRDFRTTVRAIQGVVKFRAGLGTQARPEAPVQDDNDSDTEEGSFSTDATLNLLSQFVSALAVAASAGWQLFDEGYEVAFTCDKCAQPQLPEIHFPQMSHDNPPAVNHAVDHGLFHLLKGGPADFPLQTSLHIRFQSLLLSFLRIVVSRSRFHDPPVLQMHSSPWY